jgi:outer membrane protein assembly factor BamB
MGSAGFDPLAASPEGGPPTLAESSAAMKSEMLRIVAALALFGLAFGYVEAAVVIQLRQTYGPIHHRVYPAAEPEGLFPILQPEHLRAESPEAYRSLVIEVGREAATLIMLAGMGLAIGRSLLRLLAGFAVAFGLWDIFFYVFLYVLIGWPRSIFEWDLLFLIPVPWAGPVLAPVIISATLIGSGLFVIWRDVSGRPLQLDWRHWLISAIAAAILVVSFCWDYERLLAGEMPRAFGWPMFALGQGLGIATLAHAAWSSGRERQRRRLPVVPQLIIGTTVIVVLLLLVWPSPDWELMYRNSTLMMLSVLAPGALLAWVIALSGYRWRTRLAWVAAAACAVGVYKLSVRTVRFTGDIAPIFDFRWTPKQAAADVIRSASNERMALATLALEEKPTDFPGFFGRSRDGAIPDDSLADDWTKKPPELVWRHSCGGGYSSFAVVGDLAVTIEQRGENEAIVAYDVATGQERWLHSYPAHFSEALGGDGPRATPTISKGDVFALGATGKLSCLDAASGKFKWETDILKDNDNVNWGMSGSPLVVEDLVIVAPGAQRPGQRTLLALECGAGKVRWTSGTYPAGYSSPQLATIAGQQQILVFDGKGIGGYALADGKELWHLDWETQQGINVAQPVVLSEDRVFISSGYGVGCAMFRPKKQGNSWSVETLWKNKNLRSRFASPVEYQGFLYGLDEGILVCLDAASGQRKWKERRYGHGQMLRCRDRLIILSEWGKLVLVEATPSGHREIGSLEALSGKSWNPPAIAGGRALVRNDHEMACYQLGGNGRVAGK